jgi:CHAT domain-containing protein
MKMWDEAVNAAGHGGQKLSAYAAACWARATLGDLAGARRALASAEQLLSSLSWSPGSREWSSGWRSQVERARGFVLRLEGKHAEAELALRKALTLLDEQIAVLPRFSPYRAIYMRLAVSWETTHIPLALLEHGKFAEAELYARNGLKRSLTHFGRDSPVTALALSQLARIVYEQGRYQESEALSKAALETYDRLGAAEHSFIVIHARRNLGATLVEMGKHGEADALFASDRASVLKHPGAAEVFGTGSPAWVYALVRLGKAADAVEQARLLYEQRNLRFGSALYEVHEARGYLALALAAAGRYAEALSEFRAAIPKLLAAASERSGEEGLGFGRTQRLTRVLEAYVALLGRLATEGKTAEGMDPAAEAFSIADAARGSSVQRALSAAAARGTIRDPELARLARDEQDSGQRVGTLTSILVDLLSRPPEKQLPGVIARIRQDIEELRQRRGELRQEIAKRFPDYANLIDPKPVPLEAARKLLAPGEVLITLYGTDERTFVWALPHEGEARFHAAALGRKERDALVAALRRALDVGHGDLARFPAFDVASAHRLFAELLAPLESAWGSAKSLLIVPHGSLGHLPFSLLVTRPGTVAKTALPFEEYRTVEWLLKRAAITQLPSVNTLVSLRSLQRARAPAKPFAGFGDPVFGSGPSAGAQTATRSIQVRSAPFAEESIKRRSSRLAQLVPLPDTAEELEGIAKALGASPAQDVFLRERASERNVKDVRFSDRRVIAFATHGLIPGDLDGLTQPALALSNPQVTGEKDTDGLLAMDEILGLKLDADWVVLSACNTASGEGAGSEAVSGLGRAFFYAGARALLVSNWPVETVSAKLLTTDVFRRQAADATLPRAQALRQAMLHLMQNGTGKDRDGKPLFSYAHPMFWAPFSLVGDGGVN